VGVWLTYLKLCLIPNAEEGQSINIEEGQKNRSDDTTQLANQKNIFS
jgi:hypothetical protein